MASQSLCRSLPDDFNTSHCNKKLKISRSRSLTFYSPASIYERVLSYPSSLPTTSGTMPTPSSEPIAPTDAHPSTTDRDDLDVLMKDSAEYRLRSQFDALRGAIRKLFVPVGDQHEFDLFRKCLEEMSAPVVPAGVPPLTAEEQEIVNKLFKKGQSGLASQFKKVTVDYKDIYKLYPETWLNDEIVNFYFELLSERALKNGSPSIHCFNTFFHSTLRESGFIKVKRWTKRVDIFAKDFVFVPINQAYHWVLGVMDMKNKRVAVYDSLGGNHDHTLNLFLKYLQDEHLDKKKAPLDVSDWKKETPKDIPQQGNMSDCGAFTCTFAERISMHKPFDFTQDDMVTIRRRMALNIFQKEL